MKNPGAMMKQQSTLLALLMSAICCPSAQALTAEARDVDNPPVLQTLRDYAAGLSKSMPAPHEAKLDLHVKMTPGHIWNPSTASYDKVELRSYRGPESSHTTPFVAPLIRIFPGETVRINLHNQLPEDESCKNYSGSINQPHCFNGTNLHSHGLWISPSGNSDNVLISINPGVKFQYEYNVPPDHPAGTFWYHPHRHGSTALQVASGMAGALIIQGTRPPQPGKNGDIDTLLKATPKQSFKERVLVFQQVQYACYQDGKIKTNPDGTYLCEAGDVGRVVDYANMGPNDWSQSGRYTSINGRVLPNFRGAKAGQIERWRVVHAGIRNSINLQFRKMRDGVDVPKRLSAREHAAFVAANCSPETVPQFAIAADGLTMARVQDLKNDIATFQPGYRWDLLMAFPSAGRYCVINTNVPAAGNVAPIDSPVQLLGLVHVAKGQDVKGKAADYLKKELIAAAQVNMPLNVRAKVSAELANKMSLASFVPHASISPAETAGQKAEEVVFNISNSAVQPTDKDCENTASKFLVNGKPYCAKRVDHAVVLGTAQDWNLRSDFVSHPFHIHVNPFQVVEVLNPAGLDVSGDVDDPLSPGDQQYRNMKGVWKDTLWVKNLKTDPSGAYKIKVRTRYQRYIGEFVLHCHILDHEDQGMMQNVSIGVPDGKGGVAHGHH
ncbi:multicopper oxidase domain-containing protein [Massilia sp. W12]|uniref:multicopper oxidase family protein n=1 Tax=Massilia sp. W12 TaxID=3126507 RepID=UPI0030D0E20F